MFKVKRELWVASKEMLVNTLYDLANQNDKTETQIKDEMYFKLEDYNISHSLTKKDSNAWWRLSTPLFYLVAVVYIITINPILYVLGKSIENTKFGYFMRLWEDKL